MRILSHMLYFNQFHVLCVINFKTLYYKLEFTLFTGMLLERGIGYSTQIKSIKKQHSNSHYIYRYIQSLKVSSMAVRQLVINMHSSIYVNEQKNS